MKLVAHIGIDIEPNDVAISSRQVLEILTPVLEPAIYRTLMDRELAGGVRVNTLSACAIRGVSVRIEDA